MQDSLGFVIIGRNEGQRLIDCLMSLSTSPGRVVYVDSGSLDGSVAAAQQLGAHVVELDMKQPFTAARARNVGYQALRALAPSIEFVQFVDGDCQVAEGWLRSALEVLTRRSDVAIVCGRRRERFPSASIYNALCDIEWNTPVGEARSCGGDALIRASAFDAVGGYSATLIAGEEPELCLRLRQRNWKILRIDAEMTAHDAAISRFSQWWRRMVRSGHAYAEVWFRHRNDDLGLYGREVLRAVIWGLILPLAIIAATLVSPLCAVLVLVYPLQIVRTAVRKRLGRKQSWLYAAMLVTGKFAEFQGIAKYFWALSRGRAVGLIEYKE